jgi:ER degradation enhancer, mannosidase alpha-like 1
MVFTTEGHLLTLSREHIKPVSTIRRQLRRAENLQCPAYNPARHPWNPLDDMDGLAGSVRTRHDTEFARVTVGIDELSRATEEDSVFWMSEAWCEQPRVDVYVRPPVLNLSVTDVRLVLGLRLFSRRKHGPRGSNA